MLARVREHVTPALVLALIALFAALGGVAYSDGLKASSIKSKQIKDGQVKNADLAPGAVDGSKILDNSLGGTQIDESSLAQVPSAHQADDAGQLGGQAPGAFQKRVTGTCPGAQSVQSVGADGSVACGSPAGAGTVTSVGSGTGLGGGPVTSTGTLTVAPSYRLPQSCTNNQVAKSNGAGVWNCAADADTNTTYTAAANSGLTLAGTAFGLTSCSGGQVLKSSGGSSWACAADDDTPPDPSSGDLTGSYPNPTVKNGAITSSKLATFPAVTLNAPTYNWSAGGSFCHGTNGPYPTNTTSSIEFTHEEFDLTNIADPETPGCYADVTGLPSGTYVITASVTWPSNSTGTRQITFYTGSVAALATSEVPATTGGRPTSQTISQVVRSPGLVGLRALQTSGSDLTLASGELSVAWVGP